MYECTKTYTEKKGGLTTYLDILLYQTYFHAYTPLYTHEHMLIFRSFGPLSILLELHFKLIR